MLSSFKNKIGNVYCPVYILELLTSVIKLQSSEGEVFNVETEIAKKSGTIHNMLEDLGVEKGEDNEEAVPFQYLYP